MYAFIYALSGYNIILTDINKDFEIQINNFGNMPVVGKSRCEGLESHDFLPGKMATTTAPRGGKEAAISHWVLLINAPVTNILKQSLANHEHNH